MNNDMPRPSRRRRKDNHEFGVIRLRELPLAMPACDCPERIYEYWQANIATASWYSPDVECLCVIHLNTRRRATGFHLAGKASHAASQAKWLAKPENRDLWKGWANVFRVQQWRKLHPGYWRRSKRRARVRYKI